jgi:Tfp pilus assembly protein PilV
VGRPDAGFGLISVMVAIVLLSIGVMSVSQVLTQSVTMQTIVAVTCPQMWYHFLC